jgi:hypothetical protein
MAAKTVHPKYRPVELSNDTIRALHMTANAVGPDLIPMCETNEDFVQFFLDSDYVAIYGSQEAAEEIMRSVQEFGFPAVVAAACKHCQYI